LGGLTGVTVTGNITANAVSATLAAGAQNNVTTLGGLTGVTITGNITSNSISATHSAGPQNNITTLGGLTGVTVTGNLSADNITLKTAITLAGSTGNITTTGTLNIASLSTTGNIAVGNITATGITSNALTGGGIGYVSGVSNAVTQLTSRNTAVTINGLWGTITMNNPGNLNAGTEATFVVNNSAVRATDVPVVVIKSGATTSSYLVSVTAVAAGSFTINISNVGANINEILVLSFVILRGS
jgi:hypothetical protein